MKSRTLAFAALALAVAVAPRPFALAETAPTLAVIVHARNDTHPFSAGELRAVFTSTMRFWHDGRPIMALNSPPGTAEREAFDRVVLGMSPADVGRFWIDQRIRGGPRPPRQVPSSVLVARIVSQVEQAIGYVPAGLVRDEVRVLAVVEGGRVRPARGESP